MSTSSAFPTFRLMGWSLSANRTAEADDGRNAQQVPIATELTALGPVGGSASSSNAADALIANAKKFLGQPYLWGGGHSGYMSKPGPVDCSGLVTQAAHMAGVSGLGGTAASIQNECHAVSMNDLQPGDLLFHGHPASHVGIYIGNGLCIQSPHTGAHVYICNVKQYGYFDNAGRFFNTPGHASTGSSTPSATPSPKPATRPGAPATPGGTYTVQSGDSLAKIAQRVLGSSGRWQEIYNLNRNKISNPNVIYAGQVLKLPGASTTAPKGNAAPAPKPAPKPTPMPTPIPAPAPSAGPMTAAQMQVQVAALQAELAQLDQQITAMMAQLPPAPGSSQPAPTPKPITAGGPLKGTASKDGHSLMRTSGRATTFWNGHYTYKGQRDSENMSQGAWGDPNKPTQYFCALPDALKDSNPWWHNQKILVTNPQNGKQVVVQIQDKGPGPGTGNAIDLSPVAKEALGTNFMDNLNVQFAFAPANAPVGPVK